jgi:hypothetical protein
LIRAGLLLTPAGDAHILLADIPPGGPHPYAIINIDTSDPMNPRFAVRNPWGHTGRRGPAFTVDMNFPYTDYDIFTVEGGV